MSSTLLQVTVKTSLWQFLRLNSNLLPSITIDDGPSSSYLDIPVFEVQPVKPSQVEVLQQVFPRMSASDARDAISQFGSADEAADALSQSGSSKETENRNRKVTINEKPKNSSEILLELKSQMLLFLSRMPASSID